MATTAEHAANLYDEMYRNSTEAIEEYEQLRVWVGSIVNITNQVGIPKPRYSTIVNVLERAGCITRRKRGGGASESEYYLHYAPTQDMIDQHDRSLKAELKGAPTAKQMIANLRSQLNNLQEELGGLDFRSIVGELAIRVATIENEIKELKDKYETISISRNSD